MRPSRVLAPLLVIALIALVLFSTARQHPERSALREVHARFAHETQAPSPIADRGDREAAIEDDNDNEDDSEDSKERTAGIEESSCLTSEKQSETIERLLDLAKLMDRMDDEMKIEILEQLLQLASLPELSSDCGWAADTRSSVDAAFCSSLAAIPGDERLPALAETYDIHCP